MKAQFKLQGLHRSVVELLPESDEERILLAAWMHYDQNVFSVAVERFENGLIERVHIMAHEER